MWARPPRAWIAALTLAWAPAIACARAPRLSADLVITHAAVWTGNPAQPSATDVAVIGDRIVDVGSSDDIDRWHGPRTTVIDAGSRRLIPGFNDAQVRVVAAGLALDEVNLSDAGTAAEFARRINERAKAKPGEWILGGRWDESAWTPTELPTRFLIDDITNSSPVFVVSADGRMALANAAALGRAGVTEQTADPPGGALVRDGRGFPTGVLKGTAMDIVARVVPKTTAEQRQHAIKRAFELAESAGITSVQDTGAVYEDIAAFGELANRGELTVRVYAIPPEGGWYDQAKLGVHRAFGSPWLRIGAVHAIVGEEAGDVQTRLMAADHALLQVSVGGTSGDAGTRGLNLLDAIDRANGGRDRRFRVGVGRIAPADVDRIAALKAVGIVRSARDAAAARALIDKGVRVALASGWPDGPMNPMLLLDAAIAAKVTPEEALAAFTSGSAFAEFQEGEKGTIARGKLADMVILSGDILSMAPAAIRDVRVLTTIVGGRVVHQRNP
jgi:predicted amidohydrolase YtcJ